MKTSQLSSYAPEARKAFIAAVSAQAAKLGITEQSIANAKVQGDVLLVSGQAFPASIASARQELATRVRAHGFGATMEAIAYTWFNRFAAIRYMELHGYLDHGYRVLSHPKASGRPEILGHAADVDLPGLDREKAIELKLDGTQDEELYRLLLLAQCNALHQAMPFLFEEIGDETELLLPANLLNTDSLIRQLVEQVDEALWQEIEIIGWLYQFYISEKKDRVIGKVVKSEDIPAATQLFTPNWIVKYMVQNSLGAQWVATYPQSPLKGQMEYYIEPAGQTDEVKAQLAAITPSQLNPKELTLIDPASGSGHILVEAYELFKAIYLERGYRQRDVPQLILEKNLYGLDIDERAAQLTGFALMMKGREDDQRLFERGVKLNVMALVDSAEFDAEGLAKGVELSDYGLQPGDLTELKRLFEHATTFGSLIQVPEGLASSLPALKQLSEATSQDLFVSEALKRLGPLVQQVELLAAEYDAVVANPPYLGLKNMPKELKEYLAAHYSESKRDTFAAFATQSLRLTEPGGLCSMITMQSWMFLSSYEPFRQFLLGATNIVSLAHLGAGAFETLTGPTIQTCAFSLQRGHVTRFIPTFLDLLHGGAAAKAEGLRGHPTRFARMEQREFNAIPGCPLAYWVEDEMTATFSASQSLSEILRPRQGMATSDNSRFLRFWYEVSQNNLGIGFADKDSAKDSRRRWFPYNRGGTPRKWFGNNETVVNWFDDGQELLSHAASLYGSPTRTIKNISSYFLEGLTWGDISFRSARGRTVFAARFSPKGALFDVAGPSGFPAEKKRLPVLGLLNSCLTRKYMEILNPTMHFQVGDIGRIPYLLDSESEVALAALVSVAVGIARDDWNRSETAYGFERLALLDQGPTEVRLVSECIAEARLSRESSITEQRSTEKRINKLILRSYGMQHVIDADVDIDEITIAIPDEKRLVQATISYAIGCMMGRYSLDAPGLIYAHSRNEGFDPSRYPSFPADDDGIVPLTDTDWFDDDAAHRLIEFISVAWDEAHLEANLTFLADNLSPKKNESSRETLRRYLYDKFFRDHLQTYKKRPIYWLFSSGKQKAFQCLVYLHRYNEGTLSRMRSEYLIPLQGKMAARLEKLQGDIQAATSTAQSKRVEKERAKLEKQQVELLAFDEKLRHYADRRISLDLDDGVKVNYGEFGDLLAEVKAVHGKKAEV